MKSVKSAGELPPSARRLGWLGVFLVLTACSNEVPTGVAGDVVALNRSPGERVALCRRSGSTGSIEETPRDNLAFRLARGDYPTSLVVSHQNGQPEDATHFHRIGDALAEVRAGRLGRGELTSAACRITITVAPGLFLGAVGEPADETVEHFPLVVDVPDITLRGALVMQTNAYGRATKYGVGPGATTLLPIEPMVAPIVIANGHPHGSAGNGLTIEGFVFQSGQPDEEAGGNAVWGTRVVGLAIRGNRMERGFTESIDLRATSGVIEFNLLEGGGGTCDMCLAGPGTYRAYGNTLLASNGLPGILTTPFIGLPGPDEVEPLELPTASTVSGEIANNEVRDHLRRPVAVGIRIGGIGPGAPDVRGTTHFIVRDNLLVNNQFALMVEAVFPVPETALKSDIDVAFSGNVMRESCQANLLVALTRHTTALGLAAVPLPYLRNSTYRLILDASLRWEDVWFSHPAGLGNRLIVDGRPIANGTRQFYDPDGCPGAKETSLARSTP